ncbi:MAG: hypothetical protein ACLP22_13860 [Solirubrobacteraceae bacterium]
MARARGDFGAIADASERLGRVFAEQSGREQEAAVTQLRRAVDAVDVGTRPVKVGRWSCARSYAYHHDAHTASRLTSRRVPGASRAATVLGG